MAEEPQNYPPYTGKEMPPVTPAQGYLPQPMQYTPPQYAPLPPPPMRVTPAQGKPVRKSRGGSAALVWLLGGCGVFALLFIVVMAYVTMNLGNTISRSTSALPTAQQNLEEIRAALDRYTEAHEGHYPPSLDKIVDPNVLVYTSKKGGKVHVEYTPPDANSAPDAGVAGFYLGDMMKMEQIMDQKLYIRLLKDGSVVQEQITRSPLPGQRR